MAFGDVEAQADAAAERARIAARNRNAYKTYATSRIQARNILPPGLNSFDTPKSVGPWDSGFKLPKAPTIAAEM